MHQGLRALRVFAIALAAVLIPLGVAPLAPAVVSHSYGAGHAAFELLGLTGFLALAAIGWLELRRNPGRPWRELLPIGLPLLVLFHWLLLVSEYSRKPFDYDCYEYAARAVLAGENPYVHGLIYIYPPLTAQALALAARVVAGVAAVFGGAPEAEAVWSAVFYLYQCAQLGLIALAYALLARFATAAGIAAASVPALVALLLFVDVPLFRSVRHGQVNLWVLDAALIGVLAAARAPVLAGGALALAIHLKLYPVFVLPALAAARRWRMLVATLAALAAVACVLADFGRDWTLWRQFAAFFASHFPGERAFRNSSLYSVVWNALHFATGAPPARLGPTVNWIVRAAMIAVMVWFGLRGLARERAPAAPAGLPEQRFLAHAADGLACGLLISPSVWEHHFVFALPLVLIAVALRGREQPVAVALAAGLVLAVPTFDLYPLAHHRLAGLLWLLALTSPRAAAARAQVSSAS